MTKTAIAPTLADSLKDIVLGILSAVAVRGAPRVRITEFYRGFADLVDAHKEFFPPMLFTRGSHSVYSKRLDDALQSLIGYTVALPNPQLQYLQLEKDAAARQLAWLEDKYGSEAVKIIQSLAGEFLKAVTSGANL